MLNWLVLNFSMRAQSCYEYRTTNRSLKEEHMTSAIGIISFLAIVLFFSGILHRRMELTVVSSSVAVIAILYAFRLADSFYAGVIFACILAMLGLGAAVIRTLHERMTLHNQILFQKLDFFHSGSVMFKPQGSAIPLRIFLLFETILLFVLLVHFYEFKYQFVFLFVSAGLSAVLIFSKILSRRVLQRVSIAASSLLVTAALFFCVVWPAFAQKAFYNVPEVNRNNIFANRRVMLIVPHQDDEISLLSGVMELYAAAGSEVYVVFATNGDYETSAETRMNEALRATAIEGIIADNVLFLGYGDGLLPQLYNGPGNILRLSPAGYTHTYGTATHPSYHVSDYTRNHLIGDIMDLLNEYQPDTIYCVDYDSHPDHRVTSLAFEEALGQVLRQRSDYTPLVLKGFAYSMAWKAPNDFYADNLLSTRNPSQASYMCENDIYRWDDRLRLPVTAGNLSRLAYHTKTQRALSANDSQNAVWDAERMLNGDKVFWQRPTSSVLYRANIRVSSGDASTLNDFKLIDSKNVRSFDPPFQNAWSPAFEDKSPTITIELEQPTVLKELRLYDQPSMTDNVLNAIILLDGKQVLETGPLVQNGSATVVSLDSSTRVSSIEIRITDWQGEYWGITEVEAYTQPPESGLAFVKLTDDTGNFLYDAWTKPDGTILLKAYQFPALETDFLQDCTVTVNNPLCTVNKGKDGLSVFCPVNEKCLVRVSDATDSAYSDIIRISNPGSGERAWIHALQWMEAHKLDAVNQRAYYREFQCWVAVLDLQEWIDKLQASIA